MEGAGGALGAETEWRGFIYTRLSASWEPLRGEGAGQTRVLEVEEELKPGVGRRGWNHDPPRLEAAPWAVEMCAPGPGTPVHALMPESETHTTSCLFGLLTQPSGGWK